MDSSVQDIDIVSYIEDLHKVFNPNSYRIIRDGLSLLHRNIRQSNRIKESFFDVAFIYDDIKENHADAEKYAIYLSLSGEHEKARELFGKLQYDEVPELPVDDDGQYMMLGDGPGRLGIEGIYRYARSCEALDDDYSAEVLYLTLSGICPPCRPRRAEMILEMSLEALVENYGQPFGKQLKDAKDGIYI